jgi:acyl carrier protein phosphodiesterase
MEDLQSIKNQLQKIEERNARVEADKRWEDLFQNYSDLFFLLLSLFCL